MIPIMLASFNAHLSSKLVCPEGVYRALAQRFMPRRSAANTPEA